MKKQQKNSDTSIRVLETLKFLVKNKASIQNIINHFEKIDPNNRVYTSEVILKYINTLKVFGYRFIKEKDKYVILNLPDKIDFSNDDLETLYAIGKLAEIIHEQKIKEDVNTFLQNLERRFSDKTRLIASKINKPICINLDFNYEKYEKKIKKYEQYCIDGQKLKIAHNLLCEDEMSIIAEPKGIKYKKDEVYLSVYNSLTAQIQDLNFNNITEIKQLPLRSNETNILSTTTFKLKNTLAESYKLYEGEKLLNIESDGSKIIVNTQEDKRFLLKRLMRYGSNCEVTSPKSLRLEMAEIIKNTINKYKQG